MEERGWGRVVEEALAMEAVEIEWEEGRDRQLQVGAERQGECGDYTGRGALGLVFDMDQGGHRASLHGGSLEVALYVVDVVDTLGDTP